MTDVTKTLAGNKESHTDKIWDFFCSLKLTIVTLILLAMTSIIGTVVQQGRAPQEYLKEYSETTYRVLSRALGRWPNLMQRIDGWRDKVSAKLHRDR